jgi:RimJ/RimL family protein N-acetyltransferase
MAEHAFTVLDAPRLCAVRHPDNTASLRVMDKLGMRYTGMEEWDGALVPVHELVRADWRTQSAYF